MSPAGAARTDADASFLQNVDGILGGNTGDGQIQNMRCFVSTVDHHTWNLSNGGDTAVKQSLFLLNIFFACRRDRGTGCGESHNSGHCFRAAAESVQVAAVCSKWLDMMGGAENVIHP